MQSQSSDSSVLGYLFKIILLTTIKENIKVTTLKP